MSPGASFARRAAALLALGLLLAGCGGGGGSTQAHYPPVRPSGPALGSLGHSGAGHRFYEIYDPVGGARGTVLLLHGGAWLDQRGDARHDLSQVALTLRQDGWRVLNVSYSPGQRPAGAKLDPLPMVRDVVAFYDQARRAFGGPICAYGQSAGAYLAAMLAVERPTLRCMILDAAPLDLTTLLASTDAQGIGFMKHTFGTTPSTLAAFSPTRLWRPGNARTAVFATAASNDPLVPPGQLTAFAKVDPSANVAVVPGASSGSPGALQWLHSAVDASAIQSREQDAIGWLNGLVSRGSGAAAPAPDAGTGCEQLPAARERWRLMLSGAAWQQSASTGQPIAATRGCSGSSQWQDDGISLWALNAVSGTLPAGAQATITLDAAEPLDRLTVAFRGFLAMPQDWALRLYAWPRLSGGTRTAVAGCRAGTCSGLSLLPADGGAVIAPPGAGANPDLSPVAPTTTFALPAGTRRIAWQLRCTAAAGCPLQGAVGPGGSSVRPRDPLGQPAIFSIYRVVLK